MDVQTVLKTVVTVIAPFVDSRDLCRLSEVNTDWKQFMQDHKQISQQINTRSAYAWPLFLDHAVDRSMGIPIHIWNQITSIEKEFIGVCLELKETLTDIYVCRNDYRFESDTRRFFDYGVSLEKTGQVQTTHWVLPTVTPRWENDDLSDFAMCAGVVTHKYHRPHLVVMRFPRTGKRKKSQ